LADRRWTDEEVGAVSRTQTLIRWLGMTFAMGCAAGGALGAQVRVSCGDAGRRSAEELLQDLRQDHLANDAILRLTRRGAEVIEPLLQTLWWAHEQGEEALALRASFTIGRMRDEGASAAPTLLGLLACARGPLRRNLFWALAEVGPKAEEDGVPVLAELRDQLVQRGAPCQESQFTIRCIEVGRRGDGSAVKTLLEMPDHASYVAAAALMRRMAVGGDCPQSRLSKVFRALRGEWWRRGAGWSRAPLALAEAVVRHGESPEDVVHAQQMLVYHFDFEVRLAAVMALGRDPGSDLMETSTILIDALGDGWLPVRREAVTALSMLGRASRDAVPYLEVLAAREGDMQLRVRAAHAIRVIAASPR
jgi:hypothetical protein